MNVHLEPLAWGSLDASARRGALARPTPQGGVETRVRAIIEGVRKRGDAALLEYTERFDGIALERLSVAEEEWSAVDRVSPAFRDAVTQAKANIEAFHQAQTPAPVEVETMPGLRCRLVHEPLSAVGIYAPGGSAPLPSSVLMLGIPAKIAGCPEVVLCSPPQSDGCIDPHVLYVAREVGITKVFKLGGAQAIAAMAYGTASVPKVVKVCGPGNPYVTEAKQQVSQDPDGAGIDMPAGPSELMVVADQSANPRVVAADLLSQAEHGPDSQVVLVLENCADLLEAVHKALSEHLAALPRADIATRALAHARVLVTESRDETLDAISSYAPEHLSLQLEDAAALLPGIRGAGSVFVGHGASESFGDYAAGTNHVLPTAGFARHQGGVNLLTFYRTYTTQSVSLEALHALGPHVITMAEAEGLDAHALSVKVRLDEGLRG